MRHTVRKLLAVPRLVVTMGVLVVSLCLVPVAPGTAGATTLPINGGGSTWSALAIEAWQADVARQGLTVNYQAVGSTAGRDGYIDNIYMFAVSEIPFQPLYCTLPPPGSGSQPNCTSETGPAAARPYVYMPIVAGGTSIMYNLQINGQAVSNLRLDTPTLTKIFSGVITNWDNPAIAALNPQLQLPNLPINVVVRSDGSGASAQFTAFMANQDPTDWGAFCKRVGLSPCGSTSQYPILPGFTAADLSDGVANYISQPSNNGAIGYDEAAYGKEYGIPLASLKNASGNYTQPTAVNVAVALTKATINADHTQNLTAVYTNPDPRTYPMSSYSYMIVPRALASSAFTSAGQGTTLSQFILYFLCQGQQEAAPLGYSPLPPNLVQLGFQVNAEIPGASPAPALGSCNNPTITDGFLQKNDISGGPSTTSVGIKTTVVAPVNNPNTATTTVPGAAAGTSGGTAGGTAAAAAASSPAAAAAAAARSAGTAAGTATATGATNTASGGSSSLALGAGSGSGPGASGPTSDKLVLSGKTVSFGHKWRSQTIVEGILLGLVLIGIVVVPPTVMAGRRRRNGS